MEVKKQDKTNAMKTDVVQGNKQPMTDAPPIVQPTARHQRSARLFDQHYNSAGFTALLPSPASQASLLHKPIEGSGILGN
ncbi:hypothetical protein U1Q18_032753 [Sarracenia purpurea var. burkii]